MSGAPVSTRVLTALGLLCVLAAVAASSARAEFGPIQLVSKSAKEQADLAVAPALSGDGAFVAFAGRLGGRNGVFRKDLQTGALTLVVEFPEEEAISRANPSISADGRYVAFTTGLRLDPADDPQPNSSDVYVADLTTVPPTYELASALDNCDPAASESACGLTYEGSEGERLGAVAAGRVALSADGRRVAFLTRAESNLAGPGTSAGQVAVRDLDSDRTYLMTVGEGTEEPVVGGGAATASEGAAISGDGSTVAWVGRRLPGQVPMLGDEEQLVRSFEGEHPSSVEQEYHEPLWRRIPSALNLDPPTRRIVGGGDRYAPGCPPEGTLEDVACQGPFPELAKAPKREAVSRRGRGWGITVPRLSADGNTVALIGEPDEDGDLFIANMAEGLSRRQALRRLTRWVNPIPGSPDAEKPFGESYLPQTGAITDCAISPDGNRIAFATRRQAFPLAPPTLVTPPPPGPSPAELYQVDLTAETIERVTPGPGASVSLGGDAASPSYDENGFLLAFASSAYNLVPGDSNEASDVFVVESPSAAPVDESAITQRPSQITVRPLWRITVSTKSLPDGTVRVVVGVPGSGAVRAKATARLGRGLRSHRVASAHRRAGTASVQQLTLRLSRKSRGLAHRKGGLNAEVDVDFEGPGGKPLRAALDTRFLVHGKKRKKR